MIYFSKTYFKNDLEKQNTEAALRKFASKRLTSLDLKRTTFDMGSEKRFLGLESETDIKFTRLKTSFEILPKLIISFPKNINHNYYKVRLSLFASILFGFISLTILASLVFLIAGKTSFGNFLSVLVVFGAYLLSVSLELRLTKSKIQSVVRKYNMMNNEILVAKPMAAK